MIKRLLLLPLLFFVITTTVAQANTASEQVSTFIIASPQLQTTKKMGVPPKDYINSTKRYSVLYMHDAQIYLIQKRLMQENGILMKTGQH
jgi:alpha-glucosidase